MGTMQNVLDLIQIYESLNDEEKKELLEEMKSLSEAEEAKENAKKKSRV